MAFYNANEFFIKDVKRHMKKEIFENPVNRDYLKYIVKKAETYVNDTLAGDASDCYNSNNNQLKDDVVRKIAVYFGDVIYETLTYGVRLKVKKSLYDKLCNGYDDNNIIPSGVRIIIIEDADWEKE